jgi:DNA repair protein RadC
MDPITLAPSPGPRERLRAVGPEHLSDTELVALLLGTGTAREPVAVLAARVLDELGGLRALDRLGVGALAALGGLGEGKASRIVAAIELGRRVSRPVQVGASRIGTSADVAALLVALATAEVEHFVAVAVDSRHRPLAVRPIAKGSLAACPVQPSDAFRAVLREAAAAVVFAHNHPSGDPTPSPEDLVLTERLVASGSILGIPVLDHVIVAREGHFSFLDAGLLPTHDRRSRAAAVGPGA